MKPKNGMRPVHPGEILREDFLKPLELTPRALAVALRVPRSRITDIALERRGITPDTALRLSRYFGGDALTWLNLQSTHDLKVAQKNLAPRIIKEIVPRPASVARPVAVRSPAKPHFQTRRSVQSELEIFRKAVNSPKKDPPRLQEVAVNADISTRTGKLTKAFEG